MDRMDHDKLRRGWGRGTSLGAAGAAEKGRSALLLGFRVN